MKGTIYKRGKKYSIIVDVGKNAGGKRIQRWFSGYRTVKEAEKAMVEIINDLEKDTFVMPDKITVEEYLNNWLNTYVNLNLEKTTCRGYETNIKNHIIPYIGKIKLQKLQPSNINDLYYKLLRNGRSNGNGGLSAVSIKYVHRNLRKALQQAYKLQLISKNPADFVELPKTEKYEAAFLSKDETLTMLEKFKQDYDIFLIVLLAVGLGLRRGEVLALKWSDIDLEKGILTVQRTLNKVKKELYFSKPKTKNSIRSISIPESILKFLKGHKKMQELLKSKINPKYNKLNLVNCNEYGEIITPDSLNKKFTHRLKRHGLRIIRFHDLRHTNASLMLQYGIPAKVASNRLGHANIQITLDLYTHILQDIDFEAAAKINDGVFKNFEL